MSNYSRYNSDGNGDNNGGNNGDAYYGIDDVYEAYDYRDGNESDNESDHQFDRNYYLQKIKNLEELHQKEKAMWVEERKRLTAEIDELRLELSESNKKKKKATKRSTRAF